MAVGKATVLREDLERSARDDLEDPAFPYPHLKATFTSWKSLFEAVGFSKNDIVENARDVTTSGFRRGDQEHFAHLGATMGGLLWHLGDRLRGDHERYSHLGLAEKDLRWHQCNHRHGDYECFTHPVPVVKSLR